MPFSRHVHRAARAVVFAVVLIALSIGFAPLHAQDTPPPIDPASTDESDALTSDIPLVRRTRPVPDATIPGDLATLEIFFPALNQGRAGLLRLFPNDGVDGLYDVRGRFLDRAVYFFPADDGWYALLSAGMEQGTAREVPLGIDFTTTDDRMETINTTVQITVGEFIRQQVTLPPATAALIDPALERTEIAQLHALFNGVVTEKQWSSDGFQPPVATVPLTSPFGAFRTFNGTFNTRHTGWDFRVGFGAPVLAVAAGRVVYSGELPIRGAHVVVDHGMGVYSGYSHLSTRHVTRGQVLTRGQVIGTVGSSGRVSGTHFHWELALNGDFLDGAHFLQMWMP